MTFLAETRRRRTFAIISHPDAGKTTLTEKLLLFSGAIQIAGSVKARKASRHATSDWMNGESYAPAALLNQFGEFTYGVLRLRHRHAVSRNDDHIARVADAHCGIFRADAAGGEPFGALHRSGRLLAAERAEEDVRKAAIHRL
jgi:hypothetical protein